MGENAVLQPRAMASPLVYGAAKSVATAVGVATARAACLFPVDQLDTRALAAASALGLRDLGSAVVVVTDVAAVVRECVAAPPAWADGVPPLGFRWTKANPSTLRANAAKTTR
jgi:hypothetical protein